MAEPFEITTDENNKRPFILSNYGWSEPVKERLRATFDETWSEQRREIVGRPLWYFRVENLDKQGHIYPVEIFLVVDDQQRALPVPAMNVEQLMQVALTSNVSIDTLERLLAMRRELVEEQARTAFFNAFAHFQAACPTIPKSEAVNNRDGRSVRYHFAPLDKIVEVIKPALTQNDLSFSIAAEFDLETMHLIAIARIHHAGGHTERSSFRVPISKDSFMNDAQHFGSASSYAKRYALCNALGILTGDEDDDAQSTAPAKQAAAQDASRKNEQQAQRNEATKKSESASSGTSGSMQSMKKTAQVDKDAAASVSEQTAPTTTASGAGLLPASNADETIPDSTHRTLVAQMEKNGLDVQDFNEHFGFDMIALRKTDLQAVMSWIKEAKK